LFGATLAQQVAEALSATGTDEVWEFGAGSGALAHQLLSELKRLGCPLKRYNIMDLSSTLKARQQAKLAEWGHQVQWLNQWPDSLQGVVVGNEVLDAMPVKLLHRIQGQWHERGVVHSDNAAGLAWQDRPTALRPPMEPAGEHDYLTEIQPQAEAFVASLAERMLASDKGGAAFFVDYGFPESEYFHPERHMGTVMCSRVGVFSSRASHGHRDVPSGAQGRPQPARGRGLEGHYRACEFHWHCSGRPRRRLAGFGLHQPSPLFIELGFGRKNGRFALGRAGAGYETHQRARNG